MTEDFITEFRGGASAPPFTCHRRMPDDLRAPQRATALYVTGIRPDDLRALQRATALHVTGVRSDIR